MHVSLLAKLKFNCAFTPNLRSGLAPPKLLVMNDEYGFAEYCECEIDCELPPIKPNVSGLSISMFRRAASGVFHDMDSLSMPN